MTANEKIAALQKACENTNFAYDTEYPLSQYPWAFKEVESTEELLMHLNEDYAIRNGFLYRNLAMVQQINGGDEWLTLRLDEKTKEYTPIESISFSLMQSKYPKEKMTAYLHQLADPDYTQWETTLITKNQCHTQPMLDYQDTLLVLKPSSLAPEYQSPQYQLFYATSGFGCNPTAMGQAVYGYFVADKEATRMSRSDFIGVLKEEHTPTWAKETLAHWEIEQEIMENQQEPTDITQGQ